MLKSYPLVPVNITLFASKIFVHVISYDEITMD